MQCCCLCCFGRGKRKGHGREERTKILRNDRSAPRTLCKPSSLHAKALCSLAAAVADAGETNWRDVLRRRQAAVMQIGAHDRRFKPLSRPLLLRARRLLSSPTSLWLQEHTMQ